MIMYRNLFNNWVEVTEAQKENLIKHFKEGITTMSGDTKENYIKSKFKTVD